MVLNESKLMEEHDFVFNKQNVPETLYPLLEEIENNKRKWKTLYMAIWGFQIYFLIPNMIETGKGDELIPWGLPGAKLKCVMYTPNELEYYLKRSDYGIHISQLITLFMLLENYFFEYYKITRDKMNFDKKLDTAKFKNLKKYLEQSKFADKKELLELELAKESRNCFMHRRGLIDSKWLNVHKKARGTTRHKIGDKIPLDFHDLEDWTDIMVNIVGRSMNTFNEHS